MSLSQSARLQNMNRAIKLLMDDVGDQWIRKALINPESDALKSIHRTTWEDLRSQHLIQGVAAGHVLLTGKGWEAGMKLVHGDLSDTRARVERIYHALESAAAGRSAPGAASPVRISQVSSQAGVQSVFVANVIEARLIESWLHRRGAMWAAGFEGRMILVPVDFGVEIP